MHPSFSIGETVAVQGTEICAWPGPAEFLADCKIAYVKDLANESGV
jgi:hypothetical protein